MVLDDGDRLIPAGVIDNDDFPGAFVGLSAQRLELCAYFLSNIQSWDDYRDQYRAVLVVIDDGVDVSVIVPAYRAGATLERCLAALIAQDFRGSFEILVIASADSAAQLPKLQAPAVRLITHVPRLPAAVARNRGVTESNGRAFAFTDADALPAPDWLRKLESASRHGSAVVAGSVENGTPHSSVGTAQYIVEFIDLHPRRPPRSAWHGATCNLLVPRSCWDRYGPFAEDLSGGEDTLMTIAARREGRFAFEPDAKVTHLNRTRIFELVQHQLHFGIFTARLARRTHLKVGFLVRYSLFAPVALVARVFSVFARVAAWAPELWARALLASPAVLLAVIAWTLGLLTEGLALDTAALARRSRR